MLLKAYPAVWDETIVFPQSQIGKLAAYARRSGDTWFIAAMCGPDAKTIQVPLSFLGEGEYNTTLVSDNKENSAALVMSKNKFNKKDSLKIEMINGGGFVAEFTK